MAFKPKPPAGWRPGAARDDQFGKLICLEFSASHVDRQAARLAHWLHISVPVARVVAELHFGEARI
jgi:hypothetical protein